MPLGIAFIVALFASTVVALTLTPVLCSYLLGNKSTDKKIEKEAWVARKLKEVYASALKVALAHKKIVLGSTVGLFLVALGIFFTLGRSFLPPFNEGSFTINVSSLPGISLDESDRMGHRAEELLMQVPEIQTVPSSYTWLTTSPPSMTLIYSSNSGRDTPYLAISSRFGVMVSCGQISVI